MDAETLATHVAVAKAVKDYDLRRVISFHGRVKGAQAFAADHMDVLAWVRKQDRPIGTTFTDYVSGDMNSGERNTKINRLRHLGAEERGILSNARCLSEGVDVPSLDGVAFIDPRKSQVDIVQAVGRAIRKSEGKTHGTIVIPVFIDTEENEQEALESSRFKPIWDVVNALRSHDDDLAQELDELRISLGQRNPIGSTIGGLERIVFDLPIMCEQSFVDGLRTVLVEHTTASWMFWFGLLQQYCDRNGDSRPP
jgi:predicted helicase